MAILWNPKVRRLLIKYPFLRKHGLLVLLGLLTFSISGYLFLGGEDILRPFMGTSLKESILAELGKEFEGTYREKYLKHISDSEIYTESFMEKWNILGHLDELVDEPIEDLEYEDEFEDVWKLMESFETNDEARRKFPELNLHEKALAYVDLILPKSNYVFRPVQDIIYKDVYNPKKFTESREKKWKKIKKLLGEEELNRMEISDETFQNSIEDLRERKIKHNDESANRIKHSMDHIKIFASLFLRSGQALEPDSDKMCQTVQSQIFPWLSGKLPVFKTYNLKSNKLEHKKFNSDTLCFVKKLQHDLEGRGIVITASDHLVPELSGLISLLKLTGNKYPVQIIHKNDLNQASINNLVKIASDPIMKLPKSWDKKKYPMSKITTFDLTFVDVSNVISDKYKSYFGGFGMKLLALLFNSFEEMIMLDTDTVPLLSISEYFEREAYLNSNTLFFRDREANSFLYDGVIQFFKSFLNGDYESHFLGLDKASEETLNNRFFGDTARHFMESGLFVINKKEKFDGVLLSVVLQFFKLFTGSLHGEKEFIWLGQEYMSNQYTFNKHGAVAVGELSTGREELGLKSHELCSTHPGHLADDGETLLWFNSGFLTCKKPQSYFKDVNYAKNKGKSLQELKFEYLSPLTIKNALIPPPAEYFSSAFAQDKSLKSNQIIDPEMNAEITPVQLFDTEPSRSWIMTPHCSNYLWCAYDIIQGGKSGAIVSFRPELTDTWKFWGETWVGYFKGAKSTGGDLGYFEDKFKDELGLDEPEEDEDVDQKDVDSEDNEEDIVEAAKNAVLGETPKKSKSSPKGKVALMTKNKAGDDDKNIVDFDDEDEEEYVDKEKSDDFVASEADEKDEDIEADAEDEVLPAEKSQAQGNNKLGADNLSAFSRFKNKAKEE